MKKKLITIVIPCYNEELNVPLVYAELEQACGQLRKQYEWEYLFVNDGSTDGTWEEIRRIGARDPSVRGISFSRNFGHQSAIEAGLVYAQGDAVITIDADLEQPPAVIPDLVRWWEAGYPVVHTRQIRTADMQWSVFKRAASKLFYTFINAVGEVKLEHNVCDFRLLDGRVVELINDIPESERFYRGLVEWLGFPSVTVEYEGHPRREGGTHYSLRKMAALAWTGIVSFSVFPIQLIISFAIAMELLGLVSALWWILEGAGAVSAPEYLPLLTFMLILNGIMLGALGIVSLYLLRIFREVQRKPNYIIHRTVNMQ